MIAVDATFDRLVTELDLPSIPVDVELAYTPADPFAVSMVFRTGDEDVEWLISRDVLRVGLTEPAGIGDVVVQPAPNGRVLLELASVRDDMVTVFSAPADTLRKFVDATFLEVPAGGEPELLNIDAAIRELLDVEAGGGR